MLSSDFLLENFSGPVEEFIFENGPISVVSDQNPVNGFKSEYLSSPSTESTHIESPSSSDSAPSPSASSNGESSDDNTKYNNAILRYISDILMDEEDDLQRKPCMLHDCLRLQAAEKSFSDVLGGSADPDGNFGRATSFDSNSSSFTTDNSYVSDWVNVVGEFESSFLQNPLVDSPKNTYDAAPQSDLIRVSQPAKQFHSETRNLNQLQSKPLTVEEFVMLGSQSSREKRSHQIDDASHEQEGRGSKISAVYFDDSEPPAEMLDEVLLCRGIKTQSMSSAAKDESSQNGKLQLNVDLGGSKGKATARSKKGTKKEASVDLWTLLTQCAQAVASYDQRNANDILKQIRQHSSPYGDGVQRLAHYFANGLETRLAAGTPSYVPLSCGDGATTADMLKAYKLYITASPLQRMSNILANKAILNLAETASSIHIIDFGICYGFQWPCLIHGLCKRPGGPPKLRITGIDLPQPGFRPTERVEETGQRLENYCRRFGVPFEYNCLAQKWETVKIEDLKIDRTELTIVNCMYRMKHLPDETVEAVNCPRDAVLKLIRKINPNIFIHGVANGTYNAPFFLTRFREALFHFSSLFDMFEVNAPREDAHRLMLEKGVFGKDAINVIACEGAERVERPETYKQWQVRNLRAGFKQLPLDKDSLNRVKEMLKSEYHKDFVVDEDGKWVLHGWKGRILNALSVWIPA